MSTFINYYFIMCPIPEHLHIHPEALDHVSHTHGVLAVGLLPRALFMAGTLAHHILVGDLLLVVFALRAIILPLQRADVVLPHNALWPQLLVSARLAGSHKR